MSPYAFTALWGIVEPTLRYFERFTNNPVPPVRSFYIKDVLFKEAR